MQETDYEEHDLDKSIALSRQRKISWERVRNSSRAKEIYAREKSQLAPQINKLKKKKLSIIEILKN